MQNQPSPPQPPADDGAFPLAELLPPPLWRALGARIDAARLVALPDAATLPEALSALANGAGGHVLLGLALDSDGGVAAVPGIDADAARAALDAALEQIDPPLAQLIGFEEISSSRGPFASVSVTMSTNPPHLVRGAGRVLVGGAHGLRPIATRRELDALYARGRGERERAERQVDGMVDKLLQAHYAFYGLGIVAATRTPTAEPFLEARDEPARLLAPAPAFAAEWALTAEMTRSRPGEVEVRGEREVFGYIRLTRGGCAAAGEVRRRPPGDTVASVAELRERLERLAALVLGALAPAGDEVVPRMFFEGVRGRRLVLSQDPYEESEKIGPDTAQISGPSGDPADPAYRRALTDALWVGFLRSLGLGALAEG